MAVKAKQITFHRKKNLQYYDISAKSNYQFEKPFVHLLRKLLEQPDLLLTEAPALEPKEFEIDADQQKQMAADLKDAASIPLQDDNDDF